MFFIGKPVWYLPLATITVVFFFCASSGLWFDGWLSVRVEKEYPDSLTAIFTPQTIDALYGDARLHEALLSLTAAIGETSSDFGGRYGFDNIKSFGQNLNEATTHIRNTQKPGNRKRDFFDFSKDGPGEFRKLFSLLGADITGGMEGIVDSLTTKFTGSLATPALFLGIGVGMGASTGLNLTDQKSAMMRASVIASAYNATPTGINLAVQNFGSGIADEISPAFGRNFSNGGMMGLLANLPIGSAAFALASGIGKGVSSGLNLTDKQFLPSNDSSIEAVAGNLGYGVSNPIVSNIDVQGLVKNVMMAGAIGQGGMLASMMPELAAAAGLGLGEGVKKGLGLGISATPTQTMQKRQDDAGDAQPTDSTMMQMANLTKAVSMFTEGLSESFLTEIDLTKIMFKLNLTSTGNNTGLVGMTNIQAMIPALAAGAGSGIGLGTSIGLGYTTLDTTPTITEGLMSNFSADDKKAANVAEGFTQNLVTNFLANSTAVTMLIETLKKNQPQLLKDSQFSMIAEGLARGAVEGALNGMSSVGGVQNLINGDIPVNALMNVPVLGISSFDDTVNGTAVSFAQGLTGEGTILIAQVLRNITKNFNLPSTLKSKRSFDTRADKYGVAPYSVMSKRQSQDQGNGSVPLAISEGTVSMGGQIVIDTLTCSGVGGIASVGLGVMSSGKSNIMNLTKGFTTPLDSKVLAMLPTGPVTVTSEGNRYTIVLRDGTVSINGLGIVPFGVLTALHILLVTLGFLIFLPLYLIFGVAWRFSVIARHPLNEAKNRRIRIWFLTIFLVTAIPGMVLGIVGMGSAMHFASSHGKIGLVTLVLIIPTFIATIIRLRTEIPHPLSSSFVGIKGFGLAKTNQRIYLISGILIQIMLAVGQIETTNGFTELRAISVCVVDAVFTSPLIAMAMAILLMLQITAMGLVGVRQWLEQHIAKREAAAEKVRQETEKSGFTTIETVINQENTPPLLDYDNPRTPLLQQQRVMSVRSSTGDNVMSPRIIRKEDTFANKSRLSIQRPRSGYNESYSPESPRNQREQSEQRVRRYSSDSLRPDEAFYTVPVTYTKTSTDYGATSTFNSPKARVRSEYHRPSSDLDGYSMFERRGYEDEGGVKGFTAERKESVFETPRKAPDIPLSSQPKTMGVATEDSFQTMRSNRSFSRPFDRGSEVDEWEFMGGPGMTVRSRQA